MWHAVAFLSSICLLVSLGEAQFFSEGGVGNNAWALKQDGRLKAEPGPPLVNIVDELKALQNLQQQYETDQLYNNAQQQYGPIESSYEQQQPQYFDSEEGPNPEELAKIGADIQKLLKQQEQDEAQLQQGNGQPEQQQVSEQNKQESVDQKKRGQFEFVEFVEPHAAKVLKNVEYMDKRAPIAEINGQGSPLHMYYTSNNVLFIVAVTVCSVVVVAGVVGGAYHINNIRKQRNEAFDDFTRYSPAGPGRDMLRKGRAFAGSPITDVGDDSLAKAAHLHHYEQTKQKIIGSDNGIMNDDHSDKSDDEADDLEEHNFSIYECPGLAMSGDIEVKNPNFEQQNP